MLPSRAGSNAILSEPETGETTKTYEITGLSRVFAEVYIMAMTPRDRFIAVMQGKVPDCVPVCPDFSNMIPARLTGKPFWDIYLYNDPPIWQAYIDCAKKFNIDAMLGSYNVSFEPPSQDSRVIRERFIVDRKPDRLVAQWSSLENGKRKWMNFVTVFPKANPPQNIAPEKVGLPAVPERFEPIEGVKPVDHTPQGYEKVRDEMGDQGVVGMTLTGSLVLKNEDAIYDYHDSPEKYEKLAEGRVNAVEKRFSQIMAMKKKPDFLAVGASGTLVFQTPEIYRKVAFPAVKRAIELAASAGIPTQMHSCGPERALVEIMAKETDLTIIDPLEIPPMGDCNLAELKKEFGEMIVLKGNLHTTDVMLKGSVDEVVTASKMAIDDAAAGGGFILSTGDQCGRDTPDENLLAMVETARTYGSY